MVHQQSPVVYEAEDPVGRWSVLGLLGRAELGDLDDGKLDRALELTPGVYHASRLDLLQMREPVYGLMGKREAQASDL